MCDGLALKRIVSIQLMHRLMQSNAQDAAAQTDSSSRENLDKGTIVMSVG